MWVPLISAVVGVIALVVTLYAVWNAAADRRNRALTRVLDCSSGRQCVFSVPVVIDTPTRRQGLTIYDMGPEKPSPVNLEE